jgi:hypothetical protein
LSGAADEVLAKLQEAGRRSLGDFMTFEVLPDANHPDIQNDGMKYDGFRFRAKCKLAGKIYGQSFGVDVAFGDPIFGEPELVVAEDLLAFAGIAPPRLKVYPIETHVAEKLHAYTMPRQRPNTRVKDLPDIALLATVRAQDAQRRRAAMETQRQWQLRKASETMVHCVHVVDDLLDIFRARRLVMIDLKTAGRQLGRPGCLRFAS